MKKRLTVAQAIGYKRVYSFTDPVLPGTVFSNVVLIGEKNKHKVKEDLNASRRSD
jgi:hypothetical protein